MEETLWSYFFLGSMQRGRRRAKSLQGTLGQKRDVSARPEFLFQGIRLNTFAALQNEERNVTFRGDLTITKINYIEEEKKKRDEHL